MDTVWLPHRDEFIENLRTEGVLDKIDCIIVNHGEQDHSGTLPALMKEIPGTPIYCTANAVKSLEGQYGKLGWDFHTVKTGDSLDIGNGKQLIFVEMKISNISFTAWFIMMARIPHVFFQTLIFLNLQTILGISFVSINHARGRSIPRRLLSDRKKQCFISNPFPFRRQGRPAFAGKP